MFPVADQHAATAFVEDRYGRAVAATEGIPTRERVYLVLSLLRDDHLSAAGTTNIFAVMIEASWYCSAYVYSAIRQQIDELA